MSKIYLDMDGVLADFFGGLAKFYGVEHWKMVKEDKIYGLKGSNFFHTLDAFDTSPDLYTKLFIWLFIKIPVPGIVTPDPKDAPKV